MVAGGEGHLVALRLKIPQRVEAVGVPGEDGLELLQRFRLGTPVVGRAAAVGLLFHLRELEEIAVEKQLDLAGLAGRRSQLLAHEALEFLLLVHMVVAGVGVATAEVEVADDQRLRFG
ncbi:MAG: hypothetical protein V5B36_13145 [Candidatus Accumulibacter sp. UW25]